MIRKIVMCCALLALPLPVVFGANLTSDIAAYLGASDPKQRYTACLVLGEIPVDSEAETRLRLQYKQKNDLLEKMCLAYVLAKRTQERTYQDALVKLYPTGNQQAIVWQRHADAGYPFNAISPLTTYLAYLARTDDSALAKLVSGLPFADGAFGEGLVDELASLYLANADRVRKAIRAASAEAHLDLIRRTATQKEGHRE
jgi:hypothetical protein